MHISLPYTSDAVADQMPHLGLVWRLVTKLAEGDTCTESEVPSIHSSGSAKSAGTDCKAEATSRSGDR